MSKIKLDLANFKHVKTDKNSTTLQHKGGHQLTLAHKSLSPEAQVQLKSLAGLAQQTQTPDQSNEMRDQKMAKGGNLVAHDMPGNRGNGLLFQSGGKVEIPSGSGGQTTETGSGGGAFDKMTPAERKAANAASSQKNETEDPDSGWSKLKEGLSNVKKELGFAKGGEVCHACGGKLVGQYDEGGKVPIPDQQSNSRAPAPKTEHNIPANVNTPSSMSDVMSRLSNAWADGGEVNPKLEQSRINPSKPELERPIQDTPTLNYPQLKKEYHDKNKTHFIKGEKRKMYADDTGSTVDPNDSAPSVTGQTTPDIGGVSQITGQRPGAIPEATPEEKLQSTLNDRKEQAKELLQKAHSLMFDDKLPNSLETEQPPSNIEPTQQPMAQTDQDTDKEVQGNEQLAQRLNGIQAPAGMSQEDIDNAPAVEDNTQPGKISHQDSPLNPDGTFGNQPQQPQTSPQAQASESVQPTFDDHKQAAANELTAEDQAFQHDLVNGHITPKTYQSLFADKGTFGKLRTIFGMLISGAGAGLARQPNMVMQMMDNEISRDLEAQKLSKENAQNLLKINQQAILNKSQSKHLDAETATQAYALTKMQMNNTALHDLTEEVKKLPVGSPQRNQAETTLAMLNQSVQNENFNLKDRAATAAAYYKMVLGTQTPEAENPATQIRKKQLVGAITPQQAESGLKEIGQTENHVQLNRNALDSFDKVAQMATIPSTVMSPVQNRRQIDAEWAPMMDKLTKDTEGRVTPITIEMMSHLKPQTFDSQATLNIKRQKLNAILNGGMSTPTLDSIGVQIHKGERPGAPQTMNSNQLEGKTISDANGNRMIMKNGRWIPIGQ